MRRVRFSTLALLTLISFMTSCVMVRQYKTSDVKGAIDKGIVQVKHSRKKVEADKKKRQAIYDELTSLTSDSSLVPYPALKEKLREMDMSLEAVRTHNDQLRQIKSRFKKISKGKSKIKSNEPQWNEIQKIRDEFAAIGDKINDEIKSYKSKADDFNDLLKEHRITRVKVSDIEKKFRRQLKKLKAGIKKAREEMAKYRKAGKGKEKTLAEMESILDKIDKKNSALDNILDTFKKEVSGKSNVMAGPGMKTYTIVNDIRDAAVEIQGLIEQFRVLARVL